MKTIQPQQTAGTTQPPTLAHVLVFLSLYVLSVGITIPTHPQLITQLYDGDVSSASSSFGKLISLSSALQFILSPFFGAVSDIIGRKMTMLIQVSLSCVYIGLLSVSSIKGSFTIALIAQVCNGLSGSVVQTAMASIADLSTPEKRAQNFGLVGVAFGVGFCIGPMIGALLGNITLAFLIGTSLMVAATVYAVVFLRESLVKSPGQTVPPLLESANPVKSIRVLFYNRFTTYMSVLIIVINLANQGFFGSAVHYNTYRFGFDAKQNGYYMTLLGLGTAIVQGVLMKRLIPKLGEMFVLKACYVIFIFFFVVMGYTDNGNVAFLMIVLFTVAGMSDPMQNGLMSKEIRKEDQGSLQGGLSSLMLLSRVVASVTMSSLFSFFTSKSAPIQIPGIAYYVGAVLSVVALAIVLRLPEPSKQQQHKKDE
ncbi:tetracycline resistance protein, 2C class [Acrasis kona]|uniref:Tetracycline resistance protein, 2C class n=1 Tax=Acrasis kona TaxID=1008807 RepID=A0AAW2Z4W9_9EUKA